jgi:hypothetical protein
MHTHCDWCVGELEKLQDEELYSCPLERLFKIAFQLFWASELSFFAGGAGHGEAILS